MIQAIANFTLDHYPWIKAFHIISVVAWMAGLLYLPRLFVYHAVAVRGSEQSETFKVMERRLLRGIMNPAMGATWFFGLMLATTQSWNVGWLPTKLALVVLLSAYHDMLGRWMGDFAADRNVRPQRFYRFMNEVPTLLLIAIVIFVVVKPF